MKLVLAALVTLVAAPAFAQSTGDHAMGDHAMGSMPGKTSEAAKTVEGVGQIKSIDAKTGSVSLHHGPIASLGWPAMTMSFKATPEVLKTAKAGQTVKFTLQPADNLLVAIQPQ
ncbi:copper-binding protein [Phenylobacterium sp. LjRoot225]|uniref:copper-binding protein n=1 Tax=Phenylobacterium sp. LjRoot225 TaxID=3342285 RepID=UPI003ECFE13F